MLADLASLDAATNDRVLGEAGLLAGISPYELVYGIPHAHIINAAFTHASPYGSRFSSAVRGAWYCAEELATSVAEVAYHQGEHLAEIIAPDEPESRPQGDRSTYADWLADFRTELHVLEPADGFGAVLAPEPVPACYGASQSFAQSLLLAKANGLVYPSVRRAASLCVVCFRPALVYNVRRGEQLELTLTAVPGGYMHQAISTASAAAPAG